MSFQEKLIEGKYNYYQDEQIYCEEHFKVFREDKKNGHYNWQAELLSRVETGEFLKVYVDFELNSQFEPLNIRVKRSLGASKSTERFNVDWKEKNVQYTFSADGDTKEYEKVVTGKFHISTPAFSTFMLMTQARKIDPVHRTPYDIISSHNIWNYEGPYVENTIFVELMKLEPVTITVQNQELQASYCRVYDSDKATNPSADGYPVYISKHYQIPYKAEFPNGIRVEIEKLKSYESNLGSMFKG